jgi:hypothetical protein
MTNSTKISSREDLIAALHEAAELEHGLLLQYLFAAFTLKQRPNEQLTPDQFSRLRQWKGIILGIAVEEMGHLGTVCNLLAAIGVSPHFDVPGFPQATGYYPFSFELIRFSDDALERFVTAELPRGGSTADCLAAPSLGVKVFAHDIVPDVPDYTYVGELYDAIRQGFQLLPEETLFVGSPTQQVDNEWSLNVDMRVVQDRTSALAAIDDIVVDGEGTAGRRAESHYGRFCRMWKTYRAAPFEASRPVVRNPRTRASRGGAPGRETLIREPVALAVAELFNGVYGLMLQMLTQFFSNAGESPAQRRAIRSASAQLMSIAIRPISEVLTALPAAPGEDETAGPSFELYLPVKLAPEPANRWVMLFESFDRMIAESARLGAQSADVMRLTQVADTLGIMKRTLHTATRNRT